MFILSSANRGRTERVGVPDQGGGPLSSTEIGPNGLYCRHLPTGTDLLDGERSLGHSRNNAFGVSFCLR